MKVADLNYLNGFLQAMALVNVGTNHGCWYLVECVERKTSLEESLQSHLAEFFAWLTARYGTSNHSLTLEALRDWKAAVQHASERWFFNMGCSPKLKEDYQPTYVVRDFMDKLESSLVGGVSAWSVEGASADIEWTDLLLEDEDGYYLLRFSWCD